MKLKTILNETVNEKKMKTVAKLAFELAEEMAFAESEEGKQSVGGDQVTEHSKHIVDMINDRITKIIKQEYSNK